MRHTAPPHIALQPLHMPAGGRAASASPSRSQAPLSAAAAAVAPASTTKALRFSAAFFVFGLLNNALYVVILT